MLEIEDMASKPIVIGVFGGSFDPPHLGHRQLVIEFLQRQLVDQIYLLPCRCHAFAKSLSPQSQRLQLLEQLMSSLPKEIRNLVRVEDYELNQVGVLSYSYQTLLHLSRLQPSFKYKFIIGSDQVASFKKWYCFDQLLAQFEVLVYPRSGALQPPLLPGMTYFPQFPIIDISSSQIRALQAANDPSWRQLVV